MEHLSYVGSAVDCQIPEVLRNLLNLRAYLVTNHCCYLGWEISVILEGARVMTIDLGCSSSDAMGTGQHCDEAPGFFYAGCGHLMFTNVHYSVHEGCHSAKPWNKAMPNCCAPPCRMKHFQRSRTGPTDLALLVVSFGVTPVAPRIPA
ncbi:uncharacterized protein LOC130138737 isoform X2 [Syzygium oleosum]|uniref:uncharacterized protein LOC130138737 isoform X2 n=1 Tax=Syzygium oleosum TaxID=219896 RepID=UPI0024BB7A85|nr:uncharacterized protein LOC130138737 isoform X2 [Syzygium oleosum]